MRLQWRERNKSSKRGDQGGRQGSNFIFINHVNNKKFKCIYKKRRASEEDPPKSAPKLILIFIRLQKYMCADNESKESS